jgi:RNA polymerase sigma-70 factor (ECF subfamily)
MIQKPLHQKLSAAHLSRETTMRGLPTGLPSVVAELAGAAEISDAELVRRTLAGQHDPFAALVARYQKRAFWIAFHVVGRVEDARDVAQEAFVRLFRSLAKYDFSRSFYTWFYRIVMNLAIDYLRKIRSARAGNLDDVLGGLPDDREAIGSAPMEQQEQHGLVWAILEKLDAKFRSVLVLRDIHGMSCREIAPILRITHATARWRLHRGRQVFRDHWERCHGRVEGARPAGEAFEGGTEQ